MEVVTVRRTVWTMGLVLACSAFADRGDDLVEQLSSADAAVRKDAYTGIASKDYATYQIPKVAALLDHENPEIVRAAKIALEGMVGPHTDAVGLREVVGGALCDAIDAVENDGWLFWLLSYAAEPNAVPRVRGYFDDAPLDDVVRALQGIGGEEAVKALVRRLPREEGDARIALIAALGEMSGETAAAALLNQAAQPDPIGIHAIDALGRLGGARALPAIEARLADGFDARVFNAYLQALQSLPAKDAASKYNQLLAQYDSEAVITAALSGLAQTNTDEAIRALLKALYSDEPAIHGAARNGLAAIEHPATDRVLTATLKSAGPEAKGALLEILHARNPELAKPLLEEALDEKDPAIRFTALTILGAEPDPTYTETFRAAAASGPDLSKPAALRAYLTIAEANENDEEALAMFKTALSLATANQERRRALQGFGRLGGVAELMELQKLQDVPGLGEDISETAMSIADRLVETQPGIAERVYVGVAKRGSNRLAERAIAALQAMGIERDFAKEAGYLTRWAVIGPFPNEGFDVAHPPETEYDPDAQYDGAGDQKVGWNNIRTPDLRGVVELTGLFTPNEKTIAYARTTFTVEEGGDALLFFGSDDGVAAWLNGEQVHANDIDRGLTVDSDRVPVKLQAGENVLLVKIVQNGGGWAFCARLTGPDGNPIAFEE